jgi:hypothetical protein
MFFFFFVDKSRVLLWHKVAGVLCFKFVNVLVLERDNKKEIEKSFIK